MTDTRTDTGAMTDGSALYSSVMNAGDKLFLTNGGGGDDAVTGDVLGLSPSADETFRFASSTYPCDICCVVPSDIDEDGAAQSKTIPSSEAGWVYKPGAYVPLASVDGAVDVGEYLVFSSTSKMFAGTDLISDSDIAPVAAKAIALETIADAGQIPVFLLYPHGWTCRSVKCTKSSNQYISASTLTAVTWDAEEYDTNGLHSIVSNTSRITIPATAGCTAMYHITAWTGLWKSGGAGGYFTIRLNGTTDIAKIDQTSNDIVGIDTHYPLAPGDYIELMAYTTVSGAYVTGTDAVGDRYLSVAQVGEVFIG